LALILLLSSQFNSEVYLFASLLLASFIASSIDIACDGLAVDLLRGRFLGFANTAQVGGSYLGMFLGSSFFLLVAYYYNWNYSLLACGFVILILTLPMLRIREPNPTNLDNQTHTPSLSYALKSKTIRLLLIITPILCAGIHLSYPMLSPFLVDLGLDLSQISLLFGVLSTISGILGTLIGGFLVKNVGQIKGTIWAIRLQILGLALLAISSQFANNFLVLISMTLFFINMGIMYVTIFSVFMEISSPKQAGLDFTLFQCADALSAIICGILGGFIAEFFGYLTLFTIATILAIIALITMIYIGKSTFLTHQINNKLAKN